MLKLLEVIENFPRVVSDDEKNIYFFNNWFAGLGDDPDKHRETRPYIWFEEFSSLLNV